MVEQHRLRAHHVANSNDGKFEAPRLAGRRIGRGRPGGTHAAAQHVRADHEIAFGVDRLAGADQRFPPAGFAGHRMQVGDVLVAGQGVADQHGIGAGIVEFAVSLVGDLEWRNRHAGIELQRLISAKPRKLRSVRGVSLAHARVRLQRGLSSFAHRLLIYGPVRALKYRHYSSFRSRGFRNRSLICQRFL